MAVTSSQSNHPLLTKLIRTYPAYSFIPSNIFKWAHSEQTIYYVPNLLHSPEGVHSLLHELGHAELNHVIYELDIQLLQKEAEAWQKAQELAKIFAVTLEDSEIDDCLNSYRDWLAGRSTCPNCQQTGIQKNKRIYQCINCGCTWRVNDAKWCALRRYIVH